MQVKIGRRGKSKKGRLKKLWLQRAEEIDK